MYTDIVSERSNGGLMYGWRVSKPPVCLSSFADGGVCLQFGKIILTTSVGIMDHEEARRKKMGGKVRQSWHLAFPCDSAGHLHGCTIHMHFLVYSVDALRCCNQLLGYT